MAQRKRSMTQSDKDKQDKINGIVLLTMFIIIIVVIVIRLSIKYL